MQEKLVNDEHVLHQYHLTIDTYEKHHAVQRRLHKKRVVHHVDAPAGGMITTSITCTGRRFTASTRHT